VNAALHRIGTAVEGREARLSLIVIGVALTVFTVALVLVRPFPVTFDEAKYLGIGYSMVEGRGPRTVFDGWFLPHAPVWPTMVVAPAVVLSVDPLVVGRVLNALSGIGLILLSAALAWRIRPAAGALAAIGLLATTYLHELTRTARLDVPSAMLAIAYLALALVAVRRGSARWSIGAGLLFALAFLVKEIALPLAPVPILAAILHREPWRPILRSAGWLTLSATVGVAPWFLFVAEISDVVYRLGTPGWTLLPIGLALLALGAAAVIAGTVDAGERISARLDGLLQGRRRTWLVVAVTVLWALGLTLVFVGTLRARGTALIDLRQIIGYIREWYPILITSAIGAVGLALSLLAWRAADRREREAHEDLWLATICGLPLIVLVIGVGEAPRNYLAQLAIAAGIAGAGWLWLFETVLRRSPATAVVGVGAALGSVVGLVVGEFVGVRIRIGAIAGLAAGLVLGGLVAVAMRAGRIGPGRGGIPRERALAGLMAGGLISASALLAYTIDLHPPATTRDQAVDTVTAWAIENVEPGSTIAFGSYLGYEMGLPLRNHYTVRQVRHVLAVGDVAAPDGVTVFGKPHVDDWVSIDIAPKNVNEFQAFSAGLFLAQLRKSEADYWAYTTGTTTAAGTIIPALEGATGFEQVAHWTFPRVRGEPIDTYVYRLDLDRLALDTERIRMAPDALERMVDMIETNGATELARRLAPQVEAAPATAASDALLERLRGLADASS
jgi:4-amino-4-deoxy-L-arabinose transferase-like glycosyltransferase